MIVPEEWRESVDKLRGALDGMSPAPRESASPMQSRVLRALHDGATFAVRDRGAEFGPQKRYTFRSDEQGLQSTLYTTSAVWALLRRGRVCVVTPQLRLALVL